MYLIYQELDKKPVYEESEKESYDDLISVKLVESDWRVKYYDTQE
jgi:hypothetical protein